MAAVEGPVAEFSGFAIFKEKQIENRSF